jgi:hypothetical protein
MEPACSPSSRAAGHYCSLFKIVRRRTAPARDEHAEAVRLVAIFVPTTNDWRGGHQLRALQPMNAKKYRSTLSRRRGHSSFRCRRGLNLDRHRFGHRNRFLRSISLQTAAIELPTFSTTLCNCQRIYVRREMAFQPVAGSKLRPISVKSG